jgi:uncharacterized repeat protein (TIGR01451 family)
VVNVDSQGRPRRHPLPIGLAILLALALAGVQVAAARSHRRAGKPNLVVSKLGDPPATVAAGASFSERDTTKNVGVKPASRSVTRFYLSTDTRRSKGDPVIGSRRVPRLKPGKRSIATTRLTIPRGTAAGAYFVLACADATAKVRERNERDNCRASTHQTAVTPPGGGTMPPRADLSVTVIHGAARAGDPLVFRVTVTNSGPDTATAVTLTDTWPSDATDSFGSATPAAGSCNPPSGNTVTCALGNLASGATVTVDIKIAGAVVNGTAGVGPTPTSDQQYTDSASASGATADPNPANNSATDVATVEGFSHVVRNDVAQPLVRRSPCTSPTDDILGRLCETTDGDVVADAMKTEYGTNFALMNGGGIRGDLTCAATSTVPGCPSSYSPPPYEISRGTILGTLPFGNTVATFSLSGVELWDMLEHGISAEPTISGGFPQVAGLCFTYDISHTAGARITSVVVANGNTCTSTPVAKNATQYTLAVEDFTVKGGDGYPDYSTRAAFHGTVADAVEDYVKNVAPVPAGNRITCTSSGSSSCPS